MGDSREQAQFRAHLREMRQAARGLGNDFANEFSDLDRKIERFGTATAQDARDLGAGIQDDFTRIGRAMDASVRALPGHFVNAGTAIGSGVSRAGGATRDAFVAAGKKTKEGTRNALASAAGVRRTPMREWSAPLNDGPGGPNDGSSP